MINSDKYIRACFKYALKHKFYIWVKLSKGSDTKPNGSKVHFFKRIMTADCIKLLIILMSNFCSFYAVCVRVIFTGGFFNA